VGPIFFRGAIILKSKVCLGIIFILIGVSAIFQQLGFLSLGNIISRWWPLILIGAGISQLSGKPVSKTSGIVLIVIGALFQMRKLDIITVSLTRFFWPAIIIAIGVSMLVPRNSAKKNYEFSKEDREFSKVEIDEDMVDNLALFSSLKTRNVSKNFRGGSLVAIFGGIDLDLRDALLLNNGARIDVTSTFGGVNIIVPPDWKIVVKGVPIFGGWSNKTRGRNYENPDAPVLTLHCFVAFGGVDIKNKDRNY
jgi:predicted membrane protein